MLSRSSAAPSSPVIPAKAGTQTSVTAKDAVECAISHQSDHSTSIALTLAWVPTVLPAIFNRRRRDDVVEKAAMTSAPSGSPRRRWRSGPARGTSAGRRRKKANLSPLLTSPPNFQKKSQQKLSPSPQHARIMIASRHTRRAEARAWNLW